MGIVVTHRGDPWRYNRDITGDGCAGRGLRVRHASCVSGRPAADGPSTYPASSGPCRVLGSCAVGVSRKVVYVPTWRWDQRPRQVPTLHLTKGAGALTNALGCGYVER